MQEAWVISLKKGMATHSSILARAWQPTPVFLPGEVHGQRHLVSYSPQGHKESDMTEWLTLSHFFTMLKVNNSDHNFLNVLIMQWIISPLFSISS